MGIAAVGGDVGEATAAVGAGEATAVAVGEATGAVGVAASSPSSHAATNAMPSKSSTMPNILKA
jgi:microcompartment protein CcmL/EutN